MSEEAARGPGAIWRRVRDRVPGGSRERRRKRGSRGSAELSVVVVAASLVAGLAFGEGLSRTVVDITDGLTWLSDDPSGEVIQVNPATGRPERRLSVGEPGNDLQVSQSDGRLFVTNRTTGEIFSVDLASVLVSGQRRVAAGGATDLLLHDGAAYLVDRSNSTVSRIDVSTTDAVGERWVATEGLADAAIDGEGRVWAIDKVGHLVELRWSDTERRFITESDHDVDYSGDSSVLVGHDEGVTVFGPDAGIVVQVGTGKDVVGDAPALAGRLAAPASSPSDLVPVAAPETGTVLIVGDGEFREVSVRTIGCPKPGRPEVHRGLVYVPCDSEGRIVVLGQDGRRAANDITVPGDRDAELVVDDGNLIVNVPGAQAGLIVRPDGSVDDLTRYDDRVAPTQLATTRPVRDVQSAIDRDRPPVVPPADQGGQGDQGDDGRDQQDDETPQSGTTTPTGTATTRPPASGPVDPQLPVGPPNPGTPPNGTPGGTPPGGPGGTNPPGGGGPGGSDPDGGGTDEPPPSTPPTTPTTPTTPPVAAEQVQAPTSVVATVVSEGIVEVTWAHGGLPASGFDVAMVGSDSVGATAGPDERSKSFAVPLGQALQFVVTAVGDDGHRATSAPSAPVTSNGRPAAPTGVTGSVATGAHTAGTVAATVTWEEAATTGSPIREYRVEITGGSPRQTFTAAVPAGQPRTFTAQVACADIGNEQCDAGTTTARVTAVNDQGEGLPAEVTIGESQSSAPRLPSAGNQHVSGHTGGALTIEGFGDVTLSLVPRDWATFPGSCSYTLNGGAAQAMACDQTSLSFQYNEGYHWVPCDRPSGGNRQRTFTETIVFTADNGRATVQSQAYSWTVTHPGLCEGQAIP
ncbi:fibronectin type III domain-containing protein [Nocardioides zeae]|uniref:Fibronectin type III domain-containing protein n=1 Tax=Nocardioides imazamoxiresistens TaxID=3231893 RepID=A0ABU3PRN1_9ACTN|nr:fibronectin type III domain-containing protein [Nocardioides zeae]MDT9591880.1 fibronectin type III domain-containing protein [Nocardioides zeae]